MKIVQSFWSLPMLHSGEVVSNNRLNGGWPNMKYHFMSWAYSCLQLKQVYEEVELVTDRYGKHLLIDQLRLPYTHTRIVLDCLNAYDPNLWALGKIYAFGLQDTPFVHVDGDAFFWNRLPPAIEHAQLIAQNLEYNFGFYRELLQMLLDRQCYIPPDILSNHYEGAGIHAYNAGIIGGSNIAFFREYVSEALLFVRKNIACLDAVPPGMFNALYEQHLYYCMAKKRKMPVACYLNATDETTLNTTLKSEWQFKHAPAGTDYIHLFGEDAKKNPAIGGILESRLYQAWPQYFDRVMGLCRKMVAAY